MSSASLGPGGGERSLPRAWVVGEAASEWPPMLQVLTAENAGFTCSAAQSGERTSEGRGELRTTGDTALGHAWVLGVDGRLGPFGDRQEGG